RNRALRAARRADEFVAVHQRRPGVTPAEVLRAAADGIHLSIQVLGHADSPFQRPIGRLDADQLALPAQAVDKAVIHRRRGARTFAPDIAIEVENGADLDSPRLLDGLWILDVETKEVFVAVAAAHRVDAVANHGGTGEAGAGVLVSPEQLRAAFRPCLQ